MQKALVVAAGPLGARTPSQDHLDADLRAGWRVVQVTPMGGGGAAEGFAALVVLERAEGAEAEALLDQIEEEMEGPGAPDEIQDPVLRRIAEDE